MACPGENTLFELVSGRAVSERSALDRHLGSCEDCRRLVAELVSQTSDGEALATGTVETLLDGPARRPIRPPTTPIDRVTPPAKVGRYLPSRFLGAGGMGVVYAAFDPQLRREVALKVIRPERAVGGSGSEQDRLLREAQAMAKLSHPNVVAIFDAGIDDEQVFVAMELVAGTTLRTWIDDPEIERDARIAVLLGAGRGLASGHAVGLVHRDFKPENVLLGTDARPRVTDFGLARMIADEAADAEAAAERIAAAAEPRTEEHWPDLVGATITRTGFFAGTPGYMAPEQFAGGRADAGVDQFAFCVVAWELLEGTRPFAGRFPEEILANVRAAAIQAPDPERITPRLAAVLMKGLAARAEDRHPSMETLLAAITEAERRTTVEEPTLAPPPRARGRWILAAAVTTVIAAAVALAASQGAFGPSPDKASRASSPEPAAARPLPSAAAPAPAAAPAIAEAEPSPVAAPPARTAAPARAPARKKSRPPTRPSAPKATSGRKDALIPNPWQAP